MFLIQALYYAGIFLPYIDKADKAKEYVDRMLKIKPQSPEGIALKGWVEVDLKFFHYICLDENSEFSHFDKILLS